jgi:uncharacterized coiled-coil protein SlyX
VEWFGIRNEQIFRFRDEMKHILTFLLASVLVAFAQKRDSAIDKLQSKISEQEQEIRLLRDALAFKTKWADELSAQVRELENRLQASQMRTNQTGSATISGAAYLARVNGDSILLRGLEISLCKRSAITNWNATMKAHYSEANPFNMSSAEFESDLAKFTYRVRNEIVVSVKTTIEGKFQIPNVAQGEYVLFAKHVTPPFHAAWMIPILVTPADKNEFEFNNSNARVLLNTRRD